MRGLLISRAAVARARIAITAVARARIARARIARSAVARAAIARARIARAVLVLALFVAGRPTAAQPAPDPSAGAPSAGAQGTATPDPGSGTPASDPGAAAPAPTGAPPAARLGPAVEAGDAVPDARNEVGDQAIAVELGAAAGGRVTPGGLRINGHFIYQLSDEDWFDGAASFTFGSGSPACFRDRNDRVICMHGVGDGTGVELLASVRRVFAAQGAFRPFARVGVGLGLVRFSGDDISGFTIPAHVGGGVRVGVAPAIAIVAEGDLAIGFGSFSRGLGSQPQLGLAIAAGVEFRLR